MITVSIVLCTRCQGMPTQVSGADNIPPGTYDARLRVEYGMCIPCSTKFEKGGVTQSYTPEGEHRSEES